jgi:hypothetical protein
VATAWPLSWERGQAPKGQAPKGQAPKGQAPKGQAPRDKLQASRLVFLSWTCQIYVFLLVSLKGLLFKLPKYNTAAFLLRAEDIHSWSTLLPCTELPSRVYGHSLPWAFTPFGNQRKACCKQRDVAPRSPRDPTLANPHEFRRADKWQPSRGMPPCSRIIARWHKFCRVHHAWLCTLSCAIASTTCVGLPLSHND